MRAKLTRGNTAYWRSLLFMVNVT